MHKARNPWTSDDTIIPAASGKRERQLMVQVDAVPWGFERDNGEQTMIFRIKEKFWSWGDEFSITDEHGEVKYLVKGRAFSWGDKLSVRDVDDNELAFINQKLLSLLPRYEIQIDGEVFAEVTKEWSWVKKKFKLDVPGPNDYEIEGSFWAHEFTFHRSGQDVAKVSKKLWDWTDSYGVEIVDGEDEVAILCACIVIDQVLHDDEHGSMGSD